MHLSFVSGPAWKLPNYPLLLCGWSERYRVFWFVLCAPSLFFAAASSTMTRREASNTTYKWSSDNFDCLRLSCTPHLAACSSQSGESQKQYRELLAKKRVSAVVKKTVRSLLVFLIWQKMQSHHWAVEPICSLELQVWTWLLTFKTGYCHWKPESLTLEKTNRPSFNRCEVLLLRAFVWTECVLVFMGRDEFGLK